MNKQEKIDYAVERSVSGSCGAYRRTSIASETMLGNEA